MFAEKTDGERKQQQATTSRRLIGQQDRRRLSVVPEIAAQASFAIPITCTTAKVVMPSAAVVIRSVVGGTMYFGNEPGEVEHGDKREERADDGQVLAAGFAPSPCRSASSRTR